MDSNQDSSQLSPLKRAFLALEETQNRLDALETRLTEPIAIVGMACRYPGGADSPRAYWELLRNGEDAVGEVPADRWNIDEFYDADNHAPGKMNTRQGGFLKEPVSAFDPQFFGISPREANSMDPQQRLLLEVTWEALENAALAPDRLTGSRTGVFIGATSFDYAYLFVKREDPRLLDGYYASGIAHSIISGRLSYVLGLQGPSITVDTACSSSLTAIHLAVQSLRSGETNMALAGGVSLILSPDNYIAFTKYGMLAPDGRCKTFDASANGFGRGEGCGVLVLKRLSDAQASGDRILALIRGSAASQDGASSGLTVPNGPSQEAVIRRALENADVDPVDVDFIETHGTGTSLGDPIELRALGNVFERSQRGGRPLWIGSVKTNFGHLEAAAGVAGLMKVVLSLQHRAIPQNLHFHTPSPLIAWDSMPFNVPCQLTPWASQDDLPRIGGVSSFGFSGTNVHIVLEEAPAEQPEGSTPDANQTVQLLAISARNEKALKALAERYEQPLSTQAAPLADVCYTASTGRSHFSHRLAVTASSAEQARERLNAFAQGQPSAGVVSGVLPGGDPPKIAFLFTGQGSQYAGMARGLYQTQPVFRAVLDRCAEMLNDQLDRPLLSLIFAETEEDAALLNQTTYTQPALFAVEMALVELWKSWGVQPGAVLGHSVGAYAAACAAGIFSLEDGLRLISRRAQLMGALPEGGSMAAVFTSEEQVQPYVAARSQTVSIATLNAPDNTVISGDSDDVKAIVEELAAAGIQSRPLKVSHAFHSARMDPALAALEQAASSVRFSAPQVTFISDTTGEPAQGSAAAQAVYWRRHTREAVRFEHGMRSLFEQGYRVFVEIGPSPTLTGLGQRCLAKEEEKLFWLASLKANAAGGDLQQMYGVLAELYTLGHSVNWEGVGGGSRRANSLIDLPNYPFQRAPYWLAKKAASSAAAGTHAARAGAQVHPLLGSPLRTATRTVIFESKLRCADAQYLNDHRIYGTALLPGAAFLEAALAAGQQILPSQRVAVTGLVLSDALVIADQETRTFQMIATPSEQGYTLQIFSQGEQDSEWKQHATARVVPTDAAPETRSTADIRARCANEVSAQAHRQRLAGRGMAFGPSLGGVETIWRRDGEAIGRIQPTETVVEEAGAYHLHPALLDAHLQVIASALPEDAGTYLPFSIERFEILRPGEQSSWSYVTLKADSAGAKIGETVTADVLLLNEQGEVVAQVLGISLKRAAQNDLLRLAQSRLEDWLYEVAWEPAPLPVETVEAEDGWCPTLPAGQPSFENDPGLREYGLQVLPALDKTTTDYIIWSLAALGWNPQPGTTFHLKTLAQDLRVDPRHLELFGRLIAILAEDGLLERQGEAWAVKQALHPADPTPRLDALKPLHPECAVEMRFTERCGRGLADVLAGRADPLQLLFPGGDVSDAEALYQKSITAQAYNGLIGSLVGQAFAQPPAGRAVRVLEVGAGTGGTTAFALPNLPEGRVDYLFTDVSPLFLARAREKFAGQPGFRAAQLDLEKDLDEQGLRGEIFDLIIAANVIHATTDLRRTLQKLERKLAPGGLLVLLEITAPQRWIDLSFGMTEGWWLFSDRDLRPDYPLLHRAQWLDLFAELGFEQAEAFPGEGSPVDQAVFVARKPLQALTAAKPDGAWIVFSGSDAAGDQLAAQIRASGARCIQAQPGAQLAKNGDLWQVNPLRREDYQALLQEAAPCQGIVHLWSLDVPQAEALDVPESLLKTQEITSGSALALIQELVSSQGAPLPALWLVTREAQKVTEEAVAPQQAGVWGLARSARLEHPELRCNTLDLPAGEDAAEILWREVRQTGDENQAAWRNATRYAARLKRGKLALHQENDQPVRLTVTRRGSIDNLTFQPASRRSPGPGEVEIRVEAVGLNFKDVLNTLGMYPGEAGPLGGECAGVVSALGSGVSGLNVGDEVIALAPGCFSSYVIAPASMVFPKPAALSPEEAASLPIPFITAAFTLLHLANIKQGQSVLIHAAAGGVGLAAVQFAQAAGAVIYATAGSPEKRAYLQSLGVPYVYDSRSLVFAEAIKTQTNGRGVDVVLNSLAGDFIPASLSVLAPNGCFLEIGKSGILNAEQIARLGDGRRYHVIDWSVDARENPELIRGLALDLLRRFAAGELRLLPRRVFSSQEIVAAFRYMAQARHTGKIVVRMRQTGMRPSVRANGTYLITGGLRGLGLLTAQWLVQKGARYLVLLGRSAPSQQALEVIRQMEAQGVTVTARQVDVTQQEALRRLLAEIQGPLPPIRGVFHSAGVLDDHSILQQDWDTLTRVLSPKAAGAWNLHRLTLDQPLDFFVLYSSVASVFGSPGQANHAAANAIMDALAAYRQSHGLPAVSINWGVWEEVGIAAERNVSSRAALQGLGAMSPQDGLALLEKILAGPAAQITASPIYWPIFLRAYANGVPQPFLAEIAAKETVQIAPSTPTPAAAAPAAVRMEKIRAAAPAKQRAMLLDFVRETAARVLSLNDEQAIPDQKPLNEMGLDSLMAVELRNLLDEGLGLKQSLPATLIFNYPTAAAIAEFLAREILPAAPVDAPATVQSTTPAAQTEAEPKAGAGFVSMLDDLEELSDEEVSRLLAMKMKGKTNE